MTREIAAVLAAASLAGSGLGGARPAHRPPTNLLITASDGAHWSLVPSRARMPAGTIHVELWNNGQDDHDVRVQRGDTAGEMTGAVLAGVALTYPGDISHATWRLSAGRYELYCSMPGHLAMGMHADITVTRS